MKRASKTSKAIPAVLLVVVAIAVSNWAFAQGGSISGSVKELSSNQGIEGVTITVTDASTSALAGATTTDASGNYSVDIQSLGDYTLLASKPGYDNMSALEVIELSDTTPHRTVSIYISQKASLEYKPKTPKPVLSWETGTGKSYLIPALEIPGFLLVLNGFDRLVYGNDEDTYGTNLSTFWDHLVHGGWEFDEGAFDTSQIAHMYSGTIYYGFARSAGLNFWESSAYTFAGSLLWELGGETQPPSVNDQVTSGIAGIFVGEPLFRMASLLLESGRGKPGFWRELGATVISPSTGFNRLVFGDRFKAVFPSRDPAVFQRVRLGASVNTNISDRGGSKSVDRTEATGDYSMDYGLPGKPKYNYTRPFDYFHFELTGTSNSENRLVNFMTHGLILGKKYEANNTYRGVWGLYGNFDYAYLPSFTVWNTAASLGTTAQWWLAPAVALQGTALAGIGYGWAGNVSQNSDKDYHYGAAGQGLLSLGLIFGDVAMLDAKGSTYYIGDLGTNAKESETIGRLNAGLTVRIYGHHGLGIQYNAWSRDANFPYRADSHQREGTFSLVYTLLSDTKFGAVEWRNSDTRSTGNTRSRP